MDPKAQSEAIEAKQVEAMTELFYRLQKELQLLTATDQAAAHLASNMRLSEEGALDAPLDVNNPNNSVAELMRKRTQVVKCLRWSISDCAGKIREWSKQADKKE